VASSTRTSEGNSEEWQRDGNATGDSSEDVAYAGVKHGGQGWTGRPSGNCADGQGERKEALAHAGGAGQPGSGEPIESSYSAQDREREAGNALDVRLGDFWAVEPNVGRSPDGIPVWLDRCVGRGMSYEASLESGEILRRVWSVVLSKALWRAARGLDRISQAEVLFAFVREYQKGSHEARLLVEGKEAPEIFLRGLRLRAITGSASRGSEQSQQSAGEHPDAMQLLPRLLAHNSETPWSWNSWEDAVPRVAKGIANRVDRLRGLGNAVVPQIPELFARRIKQLLEGQ
jgi:hypothetical protein